ncbi:MAG: M1 family metallopeptidase [Clostridia bacterium]|nr:M1 family metallopeptidase [Clostridia bacterium]
MKRASVIFIALLLAVCCVNFAGCKKADKLTEYSIRCELSGNVLKGQESVNFYNHTETALDCLKFNLFGNAFRKDAKYSPIGAQYVNRAYPNGLSYGEMTIEKVQSGGKDLQFLIGGEDKNVLIVMLEKEVFPDEFIEVTIDFTLTLANVVARTGYTDKVINLASFYPILCGYSNGFYECVYYSVGDPFFSDCANYKVNFTCDAEYIVASSGKLLSRKVEGTKATGEYAIKNARSFAFVLSKEFDSLQDNSLGVEINYYYYDDSAPEKSLQYAVKSMKLFNEKFGKYPYPTYAVVQTEFIQGGMEFPALVMISDNLEPSAYGEVIVHETAHQWWQSVVGNNEIEHGFLDEGLAEYSVVIFYENYPEYNLTRELLIDSSQKTYKVFCSVYDKIYGKVNTVMLRSLKDFTSEYEYVNMAYIKPCIMYDMLRQTIGDKAFFNGLKKYYKQYSFLNATPDDLVGVFEKCGTDTNGFFYSFFEGKVII